MEFHLGTAFAVVAFGVGVATADVEQALLAAIFGFFVGKLAVSTTHALRTE